MKQFRLYDYQQEMKLQIEAAFGEHRSVMVQMPTGTGKTCLLASVVWSFLSSERGPVWIVAHRRELVGQIEETLLRYGIPRTDGQVKVFSIQWLSRHGNEGTEMPGLVVIDEAHHALAKTYHDMWVRYPETRFLGLTATPCRLNGRGFTDLFDVLVQSWSIPEFIREKRLAVYDFVSIRPDSVTQRLIDSLKKRGADGDYQQKEMDEVLNKRPGIERLYESVERFAHGKKGIVYAINISHAREIASCYREHGLEVAAIDSKTPVRERCSIIADFKDGKVKVLVNVDVFSEGFDCPDVEFIQLARPTLSLAKYLQMVGRGLRVAKGKKCCMLIDNVGLYHVFGLPSQEWNWQSMFIGRKNGRAYRNASMRVCNSVIAVDENSRTLKEKLSEMMVVVRHEDLQEVFEHQCENLELETERARLLHGQYGQVRHVGHQMVELSDGQGRKHYVDLLNMRKMVKVETEKQEPTVVRVGNAELVRYAGMVYTRTRKVYATACTPGHFKEMVFPMGFYTVIDDYLTPNECRQTDGKHRDRSNHVCIIDNDDSDCYWLSGQLADKSIVVMDRNGCYYLVEKGKEKQLVARNQPEGPDEDFSLVVPRLEREARQRVMAQKRRMEDKRRQRLDGLSYIEPFRMGKKWGLKGSDGHIIVPPLYRNMNSEVFGFFVFENCPNQWGVMSRDGRILIEPKYEKVEIKNQHTAAVTTITGAVHTVSLK